MGYARVTMPPPLFSARTAWDLSENRFTQELAEARAGGRALVDLTESNPTRIGLGETAPLIALLGHPRATLYEPLALGHDGARAAVARYYEGRGLAVEARQITLSASTSEAYGWLFKLLTERGDEVLVPAPSYPLLAFLADLEDVVLTPYPLIRQEQFRIDLSALTQAIHARTRAVVVVHPNNPTGTLTRCDEAAALEEIAARHGLSLIVDEVFGDYTREDLAPDRLPSFVGRRSALTFVLSGLSKVVALPQLKLSWIVALGPDGLLDEAMRRLAVIADTYLSVSTPVQLALPEILAARGPIQAAIRARVAENLAELDAAIARAPGGAVRRLRSDAGWYAILEVPRTRDEDDWVEMLIREEGLIVHPGYFFDMVEAGFIVVSLLPERSVFAEAADRLLKRLADG